MSVEVFNWDEYPIFAQIDIRRPRLFRRAGFKTPIEANHYIRDILDSVEGKKKDVFILVRDMATNKTLREEKAREL